ncbi:MAG: hypothetical protein ACU833_12840, partial [Gammaproteobacteria bacterium]
STGNSAFSKENLENRLIHCIRRFFGVCGRQLNGSAQHCRQQRQFKANLYSRIAIRLSSPARRRLLNSYREWPKGYHGRYVKDFG